MLFGPSSLDEVPSKSGRKPLGTRWKIREVTPGAIALAAILVSIFSIYTNDRPYLLNAFCRLVSFCPQTAISAKWVILLGSTILKRSRYTRAC